MSFQNVIIVISVIHLNRFEYFMSYKLIEETGENLL